VPKRATNFDYETSGLHRHNDALSPESDTEILEQRRGINRGAYTQ
jgi:hypothetical protein